MREARQLEDQGEVLEAMWCYEALLKDRSAPRGHPALRAASLGLGQLLMKESRTSEDNVRTARLLDRAISVFSAAGREDGKDALMSLALAEAHSRRFAFAGEPKDLFAANMLLDSIADHSARTELAIIQNAEAIRRRLVEIRKSFQSPR